MDNIRLEYGELNPHNQLEYALELAYKTINGIELSSLKENLDELSNNLLDVLMSAVPLEENIIFVEQEDISIIHIACYIRLLLKDHYNGLRDNSEILAEQVKKGETFSGLNFKKGL